MLVRTRSHLLSALGISLALALLAVAPCSAQIAVRSPLAQDREISPGNSYQQSVEIANPTDRPVEARLKLRDFRFTYEGTNEFASPGTVGRSNASWIEVPQSVVTIPPNQTEVVEYKVDVPETVEGGPPSGSYWSILLVEPVLRGSAASTLSSSGDDPQLGVQQMTRYGVQIATHVGGSSTPEMQVVQANLTRQDSTRQLVLDMKNTGTEMARPKVQLEAYAGTGEVILRESASRMRIYPSTSVRYRLSLAGLDPGQYEAMVLVDTGGSQVMGFQYSLEL